jgi:hypothetical protein
MIHSRGMSPPPSSDSRYLPHAAPHTTPPTPYTALNARQQGDRTAAHGWEEGRTVPMARRGSPGTRIPAHAETETANAPARLGAEEGGPRIMHASVGGWAARWTCDQRAEDAKMALGGGRPTGTRRAARSSACLPLRLCIDPADLVPRQQERADDAAALSDLDGQPLRCRLLEPCAAAYAVGRIPLPCVQRTTCNTAACSVQHEAVRGRWAAYRLQLRASASHRKSDWRGRVGRGSVAVEPRIPFV